MARPVTGKIIVDKIWTQMNDEWFYCYERRRVWKDGKEVFLGKTLLGKSRTRGGELEPTHGKRPSKKKVNTNNVVSDESAITATRKHTGMMDIISHIGKESKIDDDIFSITDRSTAEKILSIAQYIVANNGETLPGINEWMFTHPVPYHYPITEDVYRKLFDDIGRDETLRQEYFRCRFDKEDSNVALLIAYDSSTETSVSSNPEARIGMNKDDKGKSAIKVLVLYSLRTRQPLAFAKQPANVPDVISIKNALEQFKALGMKKVITVTDGGFSSEDNLALILHSNNHTLTRVKISWNWVKDELEKNASDIMSVSNIMPCDLNVKGITVPLVKRTFRYQRTYGSKKKGLAAGDYDTFSKTIYLHLYYDSERKEDEDREFFSEIMELESQLREGIELTEQARKKAEKYLIVKETPEGIVITRNEKAMNEECRNNGIFALVSDYFKTANEALEKYRKREWIESFYGKFKQLADGGTARTGRPDNLMGRLLVQFVAMGYIEYFYSKIRELKDILGKPNGNPKHDAKKNLDAEKALKSWMNKRSLHRILTWFDAHETTEVSSDITSRRWNTEAIARDHLFLHFLGME